MKPVSFIKPGPLVKIVQDPGADKLRHAARDRRSNSWISETPFRLGKIDTSIGPAGVAGPNSCTRMPK